MKLCVCVKVHACLSTYTTVSHICMHMYTCLHMYVVTCTPPAPFHLILSTEKATENQAETIKISAEIDR